MHGELFSCKIAIHKLFACFCNCFQQSFSIFFKIFIQIFRNRTFFFLAFFQPFSSCFLYYVDISCKFLILTDREVDRCDLLSELFRQIFGDLSETCIVKIHICDKNHAWETVFLTQSPCLQSTNFYAVLSVYNNHGCICCRCCFFCFSYKIKITRCIQNVHLYIAPGDRY